MHNDVHTFSFSATVLDHLGRQLYRNFITVLGEAISNAWDADAENVWISVSSDRTQMLIIDDGVGMSSQDLGEHFLKIGYSKRGKRQELTHSAKKRPYIGAKGIGKLALLSCADAVSVLSLKSDHEAAGCVINNKALDGAVANDYDIKEVELYDAPESLYEKLRDWQETRDFHHGTLLQLDGLRMSKSSDDFLRRSIALAFRFSLIDNNFHIFYNDKEVGVEDLEVFAKKTEFAWKIGEFDDPYLELIHKAFTKVTDSGVKKTFTYDFTDGVTGFLATVEKPRDLTVLGMDEKAGVDLFVNGRLREQNILSHITSARVPESYLYGQIHINGLDRPGTDPFISSREGIIKDDDMYKDFLESLKEGLRSLYDTWDALRLRYKKDGDPDNPSVPGTERAAKKLVQETEKSLGKSAETDEESDVWKMLLKRASAGAEVSARHYTTLYFIENAMRYKLCDMGYSSDDALPGKRKIKIQSEREKEKNNLEKAGVTESVRVHSEGPWYFYFAELASMKKDDGSRFFDADPNDVELLRILRNVVMHTADLTEPGRRYLAEKISVLEKAVREAGTGN